MATTDKICSPQAFSDRIKQVHRPLVFTNGCFDLLHIGHVTYLEEAKALGQTLVVAINSDESIRRLNKGSDRPINSLEDRLIMLAALEVVDLVTWFEEDTPIKRILEARPERLVKGGDWPESAIVGAKEVKETGGKVYSIAFRYQRSTTDLLKRIRQDETNSPI